MQAAARGLASSSSPTSSSSSSSKRVFIGLSSALLRSNFRGRGKSFAASVPSGPLKPQKGKKIPKQERRVLVESFVDKYKASNAGRFPTVSHVREEIGGSYYIIKQIVQEMEYNKKLSSLNKETVQLRKAEDIDRSSDAKQESSISVGDEILESSIENKNGPSVSVKMGMEVDILQSPSRETVGRRTVIRADGSSHNAPYSKVAEHTENHTVLETEEHHSDHQPRNSEPADSSKTRNLWGNLRSLADGIISFWRKT